MKLVFFLMIVMLMTPQLFAQEVCAQLFERGELTIGQADGLQTQVEITLNQIAQTSQFFKEYSGAHAISQKIRDKINMRIGEIIAEGRSLLKEQDVDSQEAELLFRQAGALLEFFNQSGAPRLSELENEIARDQKSFGKAFSNPYLVLSKRVRLRFYQYHDVHLATGGQRAATTNILRKEVAEDYGIMNKSLFTATRSVAGKDNVYYEIQPDGQYHVYVWRPRGSTISLDVHADLIDASIADGREIFYSALENAVRAVKEGHREGHIIFISIDHNNLNLTNYLNGGHNAGDKLIVESMHAVKSNLRTNPTTVYSAFDVGFRISGDEYGFLVSVKDLEDFSLIREKINKSIAENPDLQNILNQHINALNVFKMRLRAARSWESIHSAAVRSYLQKSELWFDLSVAEQKLVMEQSKYFKKFISSLLDSNDLKLRELKMLTLVPGVSMGFTEILPDDQIQNIIFRSDLEMQKDKAKNKAKILSKLPKGAALPTKDDVVIPEWVAP